MHVRLELFATFAELGCTRVSSWKEEIHLFEGYRRDTWKKLDYITSKMGWVPTIELRFSVCPSSHRLGWSIHIISLHPKWEIK